MTYPTIDLSAHRSLIISYVRVIEEAVSAIVNHELRDDNHPLSRRAISKWDGQEPRTYGELRDQAELFGSYAQVLGESAHDWLNLLEQTMNEIQEDLTNRIQTAGEVLAQGDIEVYEDIRFTKKSLDSLHTYTNDAPRLWSIRELAPYFSAPVHHVEFEIEYGGGEYTVENHVRYAENPFDKANKLVHQKRKITSTKPLPGGQDSQELDAEAIVHKLETIRTSLGYFKDACDASVESDHDEEQ